MLASQPLTRMAAARPLFKKLLVANRGEIACRVMRTAHRMGIETVAVYSEPDSRAPHVALAGQSVCVGSAASADSYLRIDRILDAIASTGAEAVHPGYGFLSENAAFSEAVEAAGVAFVGPAAFAINAMGDKIESKRLAAEAGVTTIPGFEASEKPRRLPRSALPARPPQPHPAPHSLSSPPSASQPLPRSLSLRHTRHHTPSPSATATPASTRRPRHASLPWSLPLSQRA